MTIQAAYCYDRPDSLWVRSFILTCDNRLAVWFNQGIRHRDRGPKKNRSRHTRQKGVPGVCCLYPQSNRAMWQSAISWGSAGNYVHRFLYRKMAYQLIRPPCPAAGCGITTTCCPGVVIPTTLHMTFLSHPATPSLAIVYDSSSHSWRGSTAVSGAIPGIYQFVLQCVGAGITSFNCQVTGPTGDTNAAAQVLGQAHCSPFTLEFNDAVEGAGIIKVTT